jgi:hypothetical protein
MANIEEGLVDRLYASSTILSLVGSGSDFRCYPGRVLQAVAMPAIRWTLVSTTRARHLNGAVAAAETLFHVDAIGETYDSARTVADAIIAQLESYSGYPVGGLRVYCQVDDAGHGFYRAPDANDTNDRHMIVLAVRMWHN